ncbi:MAG: 16S rRNA (guanine(966)-N(2))-methyltransferase RsmD [Actinomycetota bacterium]
MRVIAGIAKGRKLVAPKGREVRPTADRIKEALFDILEEKIKESKVLDLYAGAGSLGIEALSRGAEFAVFVDDNPSSIRVLKRNLEHTGFSQKARILKNKVEVIVKRLLEENEEFNLIFLDPPYKINVVELSSVLNKNAGFLAPEGVAVLEHSSRRAPIPIENLEIQFTRRYGDTALSFYSKIKSGEHLKHK